MTISKEARRQRQNLLDALYIPYEIDKRIFEHPEFKPLLRAYGQEVCVNGSATELARALSARMRTTKKELQDRFAREAVDRIHELSEQEIKAVSDVIDEGMAARGRKYRYPEFTALLAMARARIEQNRFCGGG